MAADSDADLQPPDVDAGAIVTLVAGFFVFAAVSAVGLGFYYVHARGGGAAAPREPFSEPRLEDHTRQELGVLLKTQRDQLESYAWVDRGRGLARIPVARAMELLAARGAAVYDPPERPMPTPVPTPMPSLAPSSSPP